MVPILTCSGSSGSSADRSTNTEHGLETPGTQLTSDEIAYARVQARIRHDAATGEQRNARKRDMNPQGEHEQEAGTETHKEMDLDLTRSGNSGGGEHRHAIVTTLHQRRQERAKGGHESAREASAANRKRNAQPNGSPMQVKSSGRRKRASVAGRRRSAAAPDAPPLDSSAEALLRWRRDLDLPKPYSAFTASKSTRKGGRDWNAPTPRRLSARPQRAPAAGEAV